ncbi:DUF1003 domain-containing protein [archaeon]|nr:DUF1003 domain-containing protein [archaeon]
MQSDNNNNNISKISSAVNGALHRSPVQQQGLPKPKLTIGQRAADKLTKIGGSWGFIFFLFFILFIWMGINVTAYINKWDPYPFILLNLCLSCLAAVQAPVILMSQNRTSERDHNKAERDYAVNRKAEREIENIQQDLDEIKKLVKNNHLLGKVHVGAS